jgi:hypothetical protein
VLHEELMERFGIAPRNISVLELVNAGKPAGIVKPRDLWTIGANGRLDLRTGKGSFIIIDKSEAFSAPSWSAAPISDRTNLVPLTKARFVDML